MSEKRVIKAREADVAALRRYSATLSTRFAAIYLREDRFKTASNLFLHERAARRLPFACLFVNVLCVLFSLRPRRAVLRGFQNRLFEQNHAFINLRFVDDER